MSYTLNCNDMRPLQPGFECRLDQGVRQEKNSLGGRVVSVPSWQKEEEEGKKSGWERGEAGEMTESHLLLNKLLPCDPVTTEPSTIASKLM